MKVGRLVLGALLLLGLGGAIWWAWPSTERVIRRELVRIAGALSYPPNEPPLNAWAGVNTVCARLTEDAEVEVEGPGFGRRQVTGREEIRTALVTWRQRYNGAEVSFPDVRVILGSDRRSATVYVMARARLSGEPEAFFQEFRLQWRKEGRQWRIARVETVRPLR